MLALNIGRDARTCVHDRRGRAAHPGRAADRHRRRERAASRNRRAQRISEEKLYLEREIRSEHNFEEIVGDSSPLKNVLTQVEIVSPTDSTVLIQVKQARAKSSSPARFIT